MTPNKTPDLAKAITLLNTAVNRRIPVLIGNAAERHFKASFRAQGFTNKILIPWRATKSGKQNQFGKKSSGILIGTGALMKSVRVISTAYGQIVVAAGNEKVRYAQVHNEGYVGIQKVAAHIRARTIRAKVSGGYTGLGKKRRAKTIELRGADHQVKEHERKMNIPRRQFMGPSAVLESQIDKIILSELKQVEMIAFKNV